MAAHLDGRREMTQRKRVLDYMREHGSITSKEAFEKLAVTRLSAVVFDLRAEGHEIKSKNESGRNVFGERTNYCRYVLVE